MIGQLTSNQININPPITDVRINHLNLLLRYGIKVIIKKPCCFNIISTLYSLLRRSRIEASNDQFKMLLYITWVHETFNQYFPNFYNLSFVSLMVGHSWPGLRFAYLKKWTSLTWQWTSKFCQEFCGSSLAIGWRLKCNKIPKKIMALQHKLIKNIINYSYTDDQ